MKKSRKRFFSLALCLTLLCAVLPLQAQAAQFSDVPSGAWYSQAVNALADQGILSGTGSNTFSPNATLTRGQFVTMLAKSALPASVLQQYAFQGAFKDVPSSYWANQYINWAVETNVVNGYENNTFRPNQAVTRQEMAVMVRNFAQSCGKKFPSINSSVTFRDQGQIASWATTAVKLCQQANIINGDADTGRFRPNDRASRAEAASICYKYLQNCKTDGYTIVQRRVNNVAVRAVIFSPHKLFRWAGIRPEHGGRRRKRHKSGQPYRCYHCRQRCFLQHEQLYPSGYFDQRWPCTDSGQPVRS